jgi:hypothetical protein
MKAFLIPLKQLIDVPPQIPAKSSGRQALSSTVTRRFSVHLSDDIFLVEKIDRAFEKDRPGHAF